jgi:hypothetical protein
MDTLTRIEEKLDKLTQTVELTTKSTEKNHLP